MKIELDIPQVEPLIVAIHQLIDTLNDVAVAQISASCRQIESAQADEKPKAKRGRKAAEPEPEPEPEPELVPESEQGPITEDIVTQFKKLVLSSRATPAPEPIVINSAIAPEPVEAPQIGEPLTLDQIKAHAIPLQQAGKLPEAKAWLAEHGAAALKDLAPEHYDAFDAWAKAQLA